MNQVGEEQRPPSLWLVLAMPVSLAITVLALGLGLLIGVGLDEGGPTAPVATTTEPAGYEEGAALFASQGCGGCHTLSEAGASATVGPNLDDTQLSAEQIAEVVRDGRPGTAMIGYGDRLSDEQLENLVTFVSTAAGSP